MSEWFVSMIEAYPGEHPEDDNDQEAIGVFVRDLMAWARTVDPEGAAAFEREAVVDAVELMLNERIVAGELECFEQADGTYAYRKATP